MKHAGIVVMAMDDRVFDPEVLGSYPDINSDYCDFFFYQKRVQLPVG